MTILLVAHTKGGVGKSTTALNLAVLRAKAGRNIVVVDCDSGLSLVDWNDQRGKRGQEPSFLCVQLFGDGVHREVQRLAGKFDDVIIDAGGEGAGAPEIWRVLQVADKVLTPCGTSQVDRNRLAGIRAMITDARAINSQLDAMLFPFGASTNVKSDDVTQFYKGVADFNEFRLLTTVVRDRAASKRWLDTDPAANGEQVVYKPGIGAGLAVIEQRRADTQCVAEMRQLYAEVFNE